MILFQEDWAKEKAIVHENTSNKSFIRLAMILKKMDVKNNLFPLALLQPDLASYDPHNLTDPSKELRLRIALECKLNPWYLFREVVRVPSSGSGVIPIRANRASIAMIWCFFNNLSYMAIQPRQTGKTIVACAISASVLYLLGNNIETTLYTKDTKLVHANVGRIKSIREAFPKYLIHKQIKDTDNKEGLSYEAMGNRYITAIAQSSVQDADNLGRGMTSPSIHIDEPAYCDNIQITYPIMMFSTLAAVESARAAGQPHSNLLTTTAANIDTVRGRFAFDMMNRAMPFTELMYDLINNQEAQRLVKANSKNNIINGTYSYLMLGLTKEWYDEACRTGDATQEVNDRELLNIWKSGSETSLLDPELIRILNANKHEPMHSEIVHDYVVKWYVPAAFLKSAEFFKRRYILGMDSSENIGQDFTTLVLIDLSDMAVACTFRCNETNTIKLGMFIAEFLIRYPNVTFVPERNSTGGAIIDMVVLVLQKNRINPFRRIYNHVVQNRTDPDYAKINIEDPDILETNVKRYLGFRTSAKTRPYLYNNTLKKAVSLNATRVHDITLIAELSALSAKNGRLDHTEGNHDDMVIAYLLACWLIFFGENLQYYGIDVRGILNSVTLDGVQIDPEKRDRQLSLRRQIKQCQEQIDRNQSLVIKNNYRQQLLILQSQLDTTITIEPIGLAKVSQDVQDYGTTHYTPQSFAHKAKSQNRADAAVKQLINLM